MSQNNPSQLLPSGARRTQEYITLRLAVLAIRLSLHSIFWGFEFLNRLFPFAWRARIGAVTRADRPVHRVQDLGDHEGGQGARWHPLRL